jgi:hypothetical protein
MNKQNCEEEPNMNRSKPIRNLLSVAFACLALAACETNQSGMSNAGASAANSKSGARLIVHRSPTFGGGFLTLTLDGTQVANLELSRTYDSYVSPGRHVLTAVHTPNLSGQHPYSVTFTAETGKTYSYTARWQDTDLVLVRDLGAVRAHE